MRQPLFEHRLELCGRTTRALELEGEGPPLVFVHGYADSADTWRLVLERCAQAGRRAIAIDLPGYGEADRLRDGAVLPQYDALVGELVERTAQEAGEPVILAGNSLGGVVALRLGATTGLPLLGIAPIAPAGLEMPRWFTAIERDVVLRTVLASPVPLPAAIVRTLVGQVYRQLAFSRPRDAPDDLVRMFTSHHGSIRALNHVLAMGRRLLPELQSPPPLAAIRVPVLLIWGDRDRMVTHHGARQVIAAIPATEHVELPGCGHCPQLEAPDQLADLLLGFQAGAEAGAIARMRAN
jgi:pimeloyl-ACP methyl ester carboxylesterase